MLDVQGMEKKKNPQRANVIHAFGSQSSERVEKRAHTPLLTLNYTLFLLFFFPPRLQGREGDEPR